MIKAVFFDFDETIFDHKHSSIEGLSAIASEYTGLKEHSVEWMEEEFWKIIDWNYHLILAKKITTDDARIVRLERLFQTAGVEPPLEDLPRLSNLYKTKYLESARSIPGIKEIIMKLKSKGYFLGIITNGHTNSQKERLEGLGLNQYFDYVIASEEAESEKPDLWIFKYALRKANCRADEAIMIGDAWDKDIVGAVDAGLKAIWFKRREDPKGDFKIAPVATSSEELERILMEENIL